MTKFYLKMLINSVMQGLHNYHAQVRKYDRNDA